MPWGRLDDSLYDHPKVEALPDDVRLAGVGLWARAISWCNRYLTDGRIPRSRIAKLDATLDLADALVAVGLFDVTSDGYAVHDFLDFNDSRATVLERRQREAERKAEYRRQKGLAARPSGTPGGTSSVDRESVPPVVPAGVPAGQPQMSQRVSQRDSRARESRPDPTRPDPTRPTESRKENRRGRAQRADVQALLDRGWPKVTRAQRKVLDEVLERHDVTGPAFAATVIIETPPDRDPIAEVLAADRRWQERQRRRAEVDEASSAEAKERERAEANGRLAELEAML